jgi:hypothetical protein
MRTSRLSMWCALIALVATAAADESRVSGATDVEDPPTTVDVATYFPMQLGTTWSYRDPVGRMNRRKLLPKRKSVRNAPSYVVRNSSDGSREYFLLDGAGLRQAKMSGRVRVPPLGVRRVSITFVPPVLFGERIVDLTSPFPKTYESSGRAIAMVSGYGKVSIKYTASFQVRPGGLIQVPAFETPFQCVDFDGELRLKSDRIPLHLQLAPGIGVVTSTSGGGPWELVATDLGEHDLVIERVAVPKKVTLSGRRPSRTAKVKVKIRNRGSRSDVIVTRTMLEEFLHVQATSLGECPDLADGRLGKVRLPIEIRPGRAKTVKVELDVGCANDPERSTTSDPDHDDYRLLVTISPAALDVFERNELTPPAAEPVRVAAQLDVVQKP